MRRGELAAAILWPTVIGAVGALGLQESITYHIARERENAGRLLGSGLVLWGVQSVAFTVITVVAIPLALQNHSSATITSGLIYAAYVSLSILGLLLIGTLNGLHRYGSYNVSLLSIGIAIVGCQSVLLVVGAFSVRVIVIAMIGSYVACMVFGGWLVHRAHPGSLRADRATVRRVFGYGIRSNTSTTSSFLNQRLDQLVISAFLSASQLGLYVVAVTFTMVAPMIGGAVAVAALPNMAALNHPAERRILARRLVGLTLIVSTLVSLPLIAFAPFWIRLFFGAGFVPGANITRVTAVASISFATTRSLEAVLRGIGRPLAAGMAEFGALGATVVGLATLLPTFGLIGAAWASLLAYTVSGAWMAIRISMLMKLPVVSLLTVDREGLALAWRRLRAPRGGTAVAS
jgi:O-antigen/teichoic acid export membrane protein